MKKEKLRDEIAKVYFRPIFDRLSETARTQVVDSFCIPLCGKTPNNEFCDGAEAVYKSLLAILLKVYCRFN